MLEVRKNGKKKDVIKKRLQGLLMDNKNLRSSQDLVCANNSLFLYYFSG